MNTKISFPIVGCLVLASFSLVSNARAGGVGGVVAAGAASISGAGSPNLTVNQSSTRAVIDWSSFGLSAQESATFRFSSANGAVLNVISASGGQSVINGSLSSFVGAGSTIGGSVYLLNPNGVLIGSSGSVHVGSFGATTLGIDDASFMRGGTMTFGSAGQSPTGTIQNLGTISALGDVFLMANTVQNSGTISAGGTVGLAAGTEITLASSGAERLTVIAGGSGGQVGVDNTVSGQINAVTAELKAAGGNIYALAINNGGAVRANSLVNENGHIYLRASGGNIQNSGTLSAQNGDGSGGSIVVDGGHNATAPSTVVNSGTIDASGTKGGSVQVTGDDITLASGSTVNVSGATGGGTALIGGGAHGADATVQDAEKTTVESGALIDAGAQTLGNGGKVVVWSDATTFAGSIKAGGGANGGNGGAVEVSGKQLAFTGLVDTSAPNGKVGSLLLDPEDLTIDNGSDGNVTVSGTAPTTIEPDGTPESEITWATIKANLANNDVLVTTVGTPVTGTETGAITVAAASGDLASDHDLDLQAQGALTINAGINNTGTGNLTLESGAGGGTGGMAINAGISFGSSSSITLNNNGDVTGTGSISGGTLNLDGTGNVGTLANPLVTTVSTIDFDDSQANFISQNLGITVDVLGSAGGSITLTSGAATIDALGLTSGSTMTLNNLDGGTVTGTGQVKANALVLGGSGNVGTSGTPMSVSVEGITLGETGGNVFLSQPTAQSVTISGTATGNVALTAGDTTISGELNMGSGNVTLNTTTLELQANLTGGTVTLGNSGLVSGTSEIFATTLNLNGSGDFGTSVLSINTQAGTIHLGNGGGNDFINQDTGTPVTLGGNSGNGNVVLQAGAVTIASGGLGTGTGTLTLDNSGAVGGTGTISGAELDLNGSADVGSSGTFLNTAEKKIVLDESSGNDFISQNLGITLDIGGVMMGSLTLDCGTATIDVSGLSLTGQDFTKFFIPNFVFTLDNSGAVTAAGPVLATTLVLEGSGNVGTAGSPLPTIVDNIQLAETGGSDFISQNTGTAVDIGGTASGNITLTAGATTINNAALNMQGGNVSLTTTTLGLGQNLSGGTVTLNNSDVVSGSGEVFATTLNLNGSGDFGASGSHINTAAGTITLGNGGGSDFISQDTGTAVTIGGNSGNGSVTLDAGAVTIDNGGLNVGKGTLALDNSGAVGGTGTISGAELDLDGSANVGSFPQSLDTAVNKIVFDESSGANFISQNLGITLDIGGTGFGDLTLASGALTVSDLNLGSSRVTLENAGAVGGSGTITAFTLELDGSANVGTAGAPLNTSVSFIILSESAGNDFLSQNVNKVVEIGGTAGGNITLTAGQTTIDGLPVDMTSGNATFNTTSLGLGNNLLGNTVTLNNSGVVNGPGSIVATTLDLNGSGMIGVTGPVNTSVNQIVLGNGGGNYLLDQNSSQAVTIGGNSGNGNVTLEAGAITIANGGVITGKGTLALDNTGAVGGTGTISGAELDLNGSANVGSSGTFLSTAVNKIVFGETGGDNFISQNQGITVDVGGTALGNLTLDSGAATIDASGLNLLIGTTKTFNPTFTFTLDNVGPVTGSGTITATTLELTGSGNVGTAGSPVNTSVNNIQLAETAGNEFLSQDVNKTVDIEGTVPAGSVTLTAGATTVNNAALDMENGNVTLNTTTLNFSQFISGNTVTLDNSGLVSGSAKIFAPTTLNLNGSGDVGTSSSLLNTQTGTINLGNGGGNDFINNPTVVDIGGNSGGGNVTLSSSQTTIGNGGLAVGKGTLTLEGGGVVGSGTISGAELDLDGTGNVGTSGAGNALNTAVSKIVFAQGGGADFISQNLGITVDIGGVGADSLTLSSGAVTIDSVGLDAGNIALINSGAVTGSGTITAEELDLNGSANVGTAGTPLSTSVGRIALDETGGTTFISQASGVNLELDGTTAGNLSVSLGSGQDVFPLSVGTHSLSLNITGTGFDAVATITADTLNLSGSGGLFGNGLLAVNAVHLNDSEGDDRLDLTGPATLDGTTGGGDVTVFSGPGTVTIDSTGLNLGTGTLAVHNSGTVSGPGVVTAAEMDLFGTGDVGATGTGNALNTAVGTISLNGTEGNLFISQNQGIALNIGGTGFGNLTLSSGAVSINDLALPGGGSVFTLDNVGTASGTIAIVGTLALDGSGNVGTTGTALSINAGTLTFDESGGNNFIQTTSDTLFSGTTSGNVTLTLGAPGTVDTVGLNAGSHTVTLVVNAPLGGSGTITAGTLVLDGSALVGSSGTPLSTSVGTLTLNQTASGPGDFISQDVNKTVDFGGFSDNTSVTLTAGAVTIDSAGLNVGSANFTLDNSGAVGGTGTVSAGTLNLDGSANVGSLGAPLNTAVTKIDFDSTGGDAFISQNQGITVDVLGTTSGNVKLASGAVTIDSAGLGIGGQLTLVNVGAVGGTGTITVGTLNLDGSANVGSAGTPLSTKVNAITLDETGGNNFISQDTGTAVDVSGTGSGNLTLTAAATTVNNGALDMGSGNINLTTTTLTFNQDITGGTVTLHNSDLASGTGEIFATTLDLNGSGDFGTGSSPLLTQVNNLTLSGGGGNDFVNQDTGTSVNVGGNSGNGNLTLSAGAVTIDAGGLNTGTGSVQLNNSGAVSGSGVISGASLELSGNGDVGTESNPLQTAVKNLSLNNSIGSFDIFISQNQGIPVTLGGSGVGGNLTLSSGALTIDDLTFGANGTVTFLNQGPITGSGTITAGTLNFAGDANVGTSGTPLNTSVSNIRWVFSSGNYFISQDTTKTVDIGGLPGGDLTLTGGAVTIDNVGLNVGNNSIDLTTTTLGFSENIRAGSVTLINSGLASGSGTIIATTLNLDGSGDFGTSGSPVNTAVSTLALDHSGGNDFVNQDTGTPVSVGGTTGGGSLVLTAGDTTISPVLNAGSGNVTLNTTTLELPNGITGTTVTFNNTGAATGSGLITATTLDLDGSGNVGAMGSGHAVNTKVGTVSLAETGGTVWLNQNTGTALNIGGTTGGGSLVLTAGDTTITPVLNAGAGNVTLNTTTLEIPNAITGATVKFNNSGAATGSGLVTATTLDLDGSGNVGAIGAGNALNTTVGTVSLAETGGTVWLNQTTTTALNIGGTTGGGSLVLTAGDTTITPALNAGSGNVTLNITTLEIPNAITGATVKFNNTGAATGAGLVTATTLDLDGSANVGTSGTLLSTSAGAIVFGETGGNNFISQDTTKSVDIGGTTAGDVTLTAGDTTISPTLNAGSANVTLNTTTLEIPNAINGGTVKFNNSGAATGTGLVTATTLDLDGSGDVGGGITEPVNIKVSTISLAEGGGDVALSQDTGTPVSIGGTTGDGDVVLLAGATTISPALNAGDGRVVLGTTTLNLASGITGETVKLFNSGAVSGSGLINAGTIVFNGSGNIGAAGSGNAVNTKADGITFAETGGNNFISQDTGTSVDIGGTTVGDLTLTAGTVTVNSGTLNTGTGNIVLNATLLNTGLDLFQTTISGGSMTLPAINGNDSALTLKNSGTVTLSGAVNNVMMFVVDGDKQPNGELIVNAPVTVGQGEFVENSIQMNAPVTATTAVPWGTGILELVAEGGGLTQTTSAAITAGQLELGNSDPGTVNLVSPLNDVADNNVFFISGRIDNAEFFNNPALDFPNPSALIDEDLFFSETTVTPLVEPSAVFADVDRYVTVYLPPVLLGTGNAPEPELEVVAGGNSQDGYLVRSVREETTPNCCPP